MAERSPTNPLRSADPRLPACVCDGSGWSLTGAPGPDGLPTIRRCPGCAAVRLVRQFGEARTWAQWVPRPELAAAVANLRSFLPRWHSERLWACLLYAQTDKPNFGSGKTHALQALAHEFVERGVGARYIVADRYLENLRARFDGEYSLSASAALAESDGLVVLDDLGLEKPSEWTQEQVESLADWRYRHRLPTLLATNLEKTRLEARYPRLVDRCHEGLVIAWSAPSWRRR